MPQFEQIGGGNAGARQEVLAQRGGDFARQIEPVIVAANRVAANRQVGLLRAQQVDRASRRLDMLDAGHIACQNAGQPLKGTGGQQPFGKFGDMRRRQSPARRRAGLRIGGRMGRQQCGRQADTAQPESAQARRNRLYANLSVNHLTGND